MPRGNDKALSNFPSECFWGEGKRDSACSHPPSSLLSQVVGMGACVCVCVCMCVWSCSLMHACVAHPHSSKFCYPWGSGCARITLASHSGLKHKQTQVHTHKTMCTKNPTQLHSKGYLHNTHSCIHTRSQTPTWLCCGSAFQFSAQLHSTVTYSKPKIPLFPRDTHTHTHILI